MAKLQVQEGSKGETVKELQNLLNKPPYSIYSGAIDGEFGPVLKKAVKSLQHKFFLPEDGIVGDITWQAFFKASPINMPTLAKGSKGELVKTVQKILTNNKNYKGAIDGDFGLAMETAVKAFQTSLKFRSDGVIGEKTWFELSKINH
jgi:peptidoglycan hydrolase-like protein with peptidoglycan-binding domain